MNIYETKQGGGTPAGIMFTSDQQKWIDQKNAEASAFAASGKTPAALLDKNGNTLQAGLSYVVSAEPVMVDNTIQVPIYITNTGSQFAPGNCTFAITFDPNLLQFASLTGSDKNIFSGSNVVGDTVFGGTNSHGYDAAYSAPSQYATNPVSNVRSIEISYDGFTRPIGVNVPTSKTYIGTLVFNKTSDEVTEYDFSWYKSTAVLTTTGLNVTDNGTFEVIQPVNIVRSAMIVSPNGGEDLSAGHLYQISWTKPTSNATVNIEYSADNGLTWNQITSSPIDIMTQSYNWMTPVIRTTQALVRLVNSQTGIEVDRSDAVFTIMPSPAIITRPSASDPVYIGSTKDVIKWTVDDPTNIRFEFSSDNMNSWTPVTASVSSVTSQVAWTIPSVNTANAYVRMLNATTGEVMAISDEFRILAGSLNLTTPRSGDVLNAGKQTAIRWTSANVSMFDLQLSTDCGSTWVTIATDVYAVKLNYPWNISNANTKCAIIRAIYSGNANLEYSRTPAFTITPMTGVIDGSNGLITVESPVPNPFNFETNINFSVADDENVTITVYNSTGIKVATLAENQLYSSGNYTVTFNGKDFAQGMYFIHFNIGLNSEIREAVLVK